MNAKLCKALRTQARDKTVGKPLHRLIEVRQVVANVTMRPFALGFGNDPDSFRGTYRLLKKLARKPAMQVRKHED